MDKHTSLFIHAFHEIKKFYMIDSESEEQIDG